ncbi:hypothetical protein PAJ34TS1_61680 [Paenibacillus azoreducens]|uniref:Uncharacterized protein n=1 Tax=Paenibacillus azoreducens TaxID=116718 RepID=A0A919YHP5_9BACL|nr:hypothetical protein J34TS1_36500 [Paenibacillus azoreducens]
MFENKRYSGGDGIDLKKRSVRLKAFQRKAIIGSIGCLRILTVCGYINQENLEATAIGRTIRNRSGHSQNVKTSSGAKAKFYPQKGRLLTHEESSHLFIGGFNRICGSG